MIDASTAYDEWMAEHHNDWSEDEHYLNYPGLLYMFYGKVKPMFDTTADASMEWIINRIDDERFYITCDGSIDPDVSLVYIEYNEDNTIIAEDNGTVGSISEDGILSFNVKSPESHITGGYIDNSIGLVDVIDSSTGHVAQRVPGFGTGYVNIFIDI